MKSKLDLRAKPQPLFPLFVILACLLALTPKAVYASTITLATCETGELISAINTANANAEADTIELKADCVYTLTAVNSTGDCANEPNGLPNITSEITIRGNDATIARSTADGTPDFRLFHVSESGTLVLEQVRLMGGNQINGGAIQNKGELRISDSTFSENIGSEGGCGYSFGGGAIQNTVGATLLVTDTLFTRNVSSLFGGAVRNDGTATFTNSTFANQVTGSGGAIMNSNGSLTVTQSLFSQNEGGTFGGGAILNLGGTVNVANTTFFGNRSPFWGGGIRNGGTGSVSTIVIINSAISGNSAHPNYGGGGISNSSDLTLINSIVSKNTNGNCAGTITDGGGNLRYPTSDSTCVGTFGDPKLGPLMNNGGPTLTMALRSASAAIDAGLDAVCGSAPVNNLDQRSVVRPVDGDNNGSVHCDIGAYEANCPETKPAKAMLKSPVDDAQTSRRRPKLKWQGVTCTDTYSVIVKNTLDGKVADKAVGLNTLKYKTNLLAVGATYKWFVKACNPSGCSKSAKRTFTVQ